MSRTSATASRSRTGPGASSLTSTDARCGPRNVPDRYRRCSRREPWVSVFGQPRGVHGDVLGSRGCRRGCARDAHLSHVAPRAYIAGRPACSHCVGEVPARQRLVSDGAFGAAAQRQDGALRVRRTIVDRVEPVADPGSHGRTRARYALRPAVLVPERPWQLEVEHAASGGAAGEYRPRPRRRLLRAPRGAAPASADQDHPDLARGWGIQERGLEQARQARVPGAAQRPPEIHVRHRRIHTSRSGVRGGVRHRGIRRHPDRPAADRHVSRPGALRPGCRAPLRGSAVVAREADHPVRADLPWQGHKHGPLRLLTDRLRQAP